MSQIAMSNESRREILQGYGYNPREAQFLVMAALHGGYFLRRQYARFLCQSAGGTTAALVDKIITRGHARTSALAGNTVLYHLCARPFYALLGQSDNRNRREKQPLTIKNKLMSLDFVLDHQTKRYLATEQEKVDYFNGQLGVEIGKLPAKIYSSTASKTERYFVEKYPVFIEQESSLVTFCFVDEGLTTGSRFETFLQQYSRLFSALSRFHVVYVAPNSVPFRWAASIFERYSVRLKSQVGGTALDPAITELIEYFANRLKFESGDVASFDRSKLIQFRNARQKFSNTRNDGLFARWKAEGDQGVLAILTPESRPSAPSVGTFSTHLLRHNYDLFGTLTTYK